MRYLIAVSILLASYEAAGQIKCGSNAFAGVFDKGGGKSVGVTMAFSADKRTSIGIICDSEGLAVGLWNKHLPFDRVGTTPLTMVMLRFDLDSPKRIPGLAKDNNAILPGKLIVRLVQSNRVGISYHSARKIRVAIIDTTALSTCFQLILPVCKQSTGQKYARRGK